MQLLSSGNQVQLEVCDDFDGFAQRLSPRPERDWIRNRFHFHGELRELVSSVGEALERTQGNRQQSAIDSTSETLSTRSMCLWVGTPFQVAISGDVRVGRSRRPPPAQPGGNQTCKSDFPPSRIDITEGESRNPRDHRQDAPSWMGHPVSTLPDE